LAACLQAEIERMASMAAAAGGRAPPAAPGGPPNAEQFKKMKEMMDKDPDAMEKVRQ
jgi:spore coat protein CotH